MKKLMIASDIHGSAYYCRKMLEAFDREQADRLLLLGGPQGRPFCFCSALRRCNHRKNMV